MVDRAIFDLLNEFSDPAAADGIEVQRAGGGTTYRLLLSALHVGLTLADTTEAEAGVDTAKLMTPATTAAAIAALAAGLTDHGSLSGLADNDHPQYLQNLSEDTTPSLGGDLDLADETVSGGTLREISEAAAIVEHTSAGNFTPDLTNGNEQIVNVAANITIQSPSILAADIPGEGNRVVRMTQDFRVQSPGGFTMAFAGGITSVGNIPALKNATGDRNLVQWAYDSDLNAWHVIGDPIEAYDNQGNISGTITPDFDNRRTDRMELLIAGNINGATTFAAPINPPGTDEYGKIMFILQTNATNNPTFNAVYQFGTSGQPDLSALADNTVVTILAIKEPGAGTDYLTYVVKQDHPAVF